MCWEDTLRIAQILNAIGLVVIGGVGAWIAIEQRRIAKHRLAVDLFDKRFEVLKTASDVWGRVLIVGQAEPKDCADFQDMRIRSLVLFSPKVVKATGDIEDQLNRNVKAKSDLAQAQTQQARTTASEERADSIAKIIHQFPSAINLLVKEIKV